MSVLKSLLGTFGSNVAFFVFLRTLFFRAVLGSQQN